MKTKIQLRTDRPNFGERVVFIAFTENDTPSIYYGIYQSIDAVTGLFMTMPLVPYEEGFEYESFSTGRVVGWLSEKDVQGIMQ